MLRPLLASVRNGVVKTFRCTHQISVSDELQTHEVDLNATLTLRFHGPQGDAQVYFGTIGDDSSISNDLIHEFIDAHGYTDPNCADDPFGGHVSCLIASSSDSLLLQFPESRRELVISQLKAMLSSA